MEDINAQDETPQIDTANVRLPWDIDPDNDLPLLSPFDNSTPGSNLSLESRSSLQLHIYPIQESILSH